MDTTVIWLSGLQFRSHSHLFYNSAPWWKNILKDFETQLQSLQWPVNISDSKCKLALKQFSLHANTFDVHVTLQQTHLLCYAGTSEISASFLDGKELGAFCIEPAPHLLCLSHLSEGSFLHLYCCIWVLLYKSGLCHRDGGNEGSVAGVISNPWYRLKHSTDHSLGKTECICRN